MMEQIEHLRAFSLTQSAEDAKTEIAIIKTKLSMIDTVYGLPDRIREMAELIERKGNMKARFAAAQESGDIQYFDNRNPKKEETSDGVVYVAKKARK